MKCYKFSLKLPFESFLYEWIKAMISLFLGVFSIQLTQIKYKMYFKLIFRLKDLY